MISSLYQFKFCVLLGFLFVFSGFSIHAQNVSGFVLDENNQPIPYVNIYLKNTNTGTSTDIDGKYFLTLPPGDYDLVFSSVGYKLYEYHVVMREKPVVKNVWMVSADQELEEIVIKASKKDPAYEIIQKVIDNRKDSQVKSVKTDVYVKAIEVTERKEKENEKKKEIVSLQGESLDPFEADNNAAKAELRGTNMVEMNLTLNFQYPGHYKEERTGIKAYGDQSGLFLPRFSETDLNIYNNLIHLEGVMSTPVISPIGRTSILSYRYKLEDIAEENGIQVYKIKVIPRKKGNSTCIGHIYVNDSLWNVNRFELEFEKGSLKIYDSFILRQAYQPQENDSLWIPYRQEFSYNTSQGKFKTFRGNTVILYSNYQIDFPFPEKFFGNEVSIATKETYERDSSYWNSTRPEPLTYEEQEVVHYRDSLHAVLNSVAYKDSIDAKYNKITLGDLLLDGIGYRNHTKQKNIYLSSILNMVDFSVVGGFRVAFYSSFFKRFNSGKLLWANVSPSFGLRNSDLQGSGTLFFRYEPFKLGDIQISGGRRFQSINPFDAYLNQLRLSNYILHDFGSIFHRRELFNGFYTKVFAEYNIRKSVTNLETRSIINDVIDQDDPLDFEDYEAFITDLSISYTPAQQYMREPNFKRVLGSDWPTFTLTYRKGWDDIIGSDIDFDYLEGRINQDLVLGIFGNSKYNIQVGKFFNKTDLRFVDVRRFRQSDPYLYSDPLNSFQLLDTAMMATNWFFEAHHIHHFNGALINNIPLVKKLRFNVVAGAGILWIYENKYRHEEVFAGIERIFKFGARRRLRVGVYGVISESNYTPLNTGWKISFDIIDTWKTEWSY